MARLRAILAENCGFQSDSTAILSYCFGIMSENTPSESQTPGLNEIYLDHVGWFVPDMNEASEAFRRLGFPLTPFTVHMNEQSDGSRVPSGTANRCGMIERGYLEVLTRVPEVESAITKQMDEGLARYTGLHLIAFTVSDTEATMERLRTAGFEPNPPVALRRPMPLDAGGEGTAAFSVIRLPSDAMAEGRVQVLSQDTPDVVWQRSVIASDNSAEMLSGLLICAGDPDETVQRYERFTGKTAEARGEGYQIGLDRGQIAICSPSECEQILPGIDVPDLPFIAAASIRSRDVGETRAFFMAQAVPFLAGDGSRIVVGRAAGMGAAFVFHASGQEPFPIP